MCDSKTCNECGQPALYWDKGWDDELWGGEPDSYWCEEHKHFKPGAEPLPFTKPEEPSHEPPQQ
jgi:hypothetical protein